MGNRGIIFFLLLLKGASLHATGFVSRSAHSDCDALFDAVARSLPTESTKSSLLNSDTKDVKGFLKRLETEILDSQKLAESAENREKSSQKPLLFNIPSGQGWRFRSENLRERTYTEEEYYTIQQKFNKLKAAFESPQSMTFSYLSDLAPIRELFFTRNTVVDTDLQSRREWMGRLSGLTAGFIGGIFKPVVSRSLFGPGDINEKIIESARAEMSKTLQTHLGRVEETLKELGYSKTFIKKAIENHLADLKKAEEEGNSASFGGRPSDYSRTLGPKETNPRGYLLQLANTKIRYREEEEDTVNSLKKHLELSEKYLSELGYEPEEVEAILAEHVKVLKRRTEDGANFTYGAHPNAYVGFPPDYKTYQTELRRLATHHPTRFSEDTLDKEFKEYMEKESYRRDNEYPSTNTFTLDEMRKKAEARASEYSWTDSAIDGVMGLVLGTVVGDIAAKKPGRDLATLVHHRGKKSPLPAPILQELRDFLKSPKPGKNWYWIGRNIGAEHVDLLIEDDNSTTGRITQFLGVKYKTSLDYQNPRPEPQAPVTVGEAMKPQEPPKPRKPAVPVENPTQVLNQLEKDFLEINLASDFGNETKRVQEIFKKAHQYVVKPDQLNQFRNHYRRVNAEGLGVLDRYLQFLEDTNKK